MTDQPAARAWVSKSSPLSRWRPIAGFGLLVAAIVFLMGLVVANVAGHEVQCSGRGLVIFILALSTGGAAGFLSGEAAAEGRIPFLGGNVIKIATTGAIGAIVVVMALGFPLYANTCPAQIIESDPRDPGAFKAQIEITQRFWDVAHKRQWKEVYGFFPLAVTNSMAFTQFEDIVSKGFSQFPKPPRYTRVESPNVVQGSLYIWLIAEFDTASTFRQFLMFNRQGSDWLPWRFDTGPVEWPLASGTKVLPQQKAQEIVTLAASFPAANRDTLINDRFVGGLTTGNGWQVVVDGLGVRRAEHTCDVSAHEEVTLTTVKLSRVLGGCDLKNGETIRVVGRVDNVTNEGLSLDAVRLWR